VKLVPDKISFFNRYQQVSYLRQTMENEPITIKLKSKLCEKFNSDCDEKCHRAIKLPIFVFHFDALHPMMRNDMFITMNNVHTSKPKLR
jgi:hypothetical protein